jgi:glycosyltransferase involved in cell wall biosynthesis
MNKLIVAILGENCEKTIGMCLESVKDADDIIYIDGGSTDNTIQIGEDFVKKNGFNQVQIVSGNEIKNSSCKCLFNKFDKSNPNAISIQRNFYLDYLKEHHKDDWCLVLDADEVLDDGGIKVFRDLIKDPFSDVYSIRMRHLMYNLALEDASQQYHFVPNRFFKVTDKLSYPDGEHCVLQGGGDDGKIVSTQIWHLAYLGGAWDVQKRYEQQMIRNSGHSLEYLDNWNKAHMLGKYPIKQFNPLELPDMILTNFGLNKDELYFEGRGLEAKHFIDAIHWRDFFKPESAIEFGCGRGPRVFAMNHTGINCVGMEISGFAVKHSLYPSVRKGNVTKDWQSTHQLVIAYDLLEHIKYEDIDSAISNIIAHSLQYILVSVPYKDTPNCNNDPTHIIKENRDWWVNKFVSKELKEVEVPEHFLFKEQLLIFEK